MLSEPPVIAIVDDEESVRKALVRLFRSADFSAVEFSSAQAFLQALETMTVDCLVLDLQMPDMTGLELQNYLCVECPHMHHIPVVIITAHDELGARERCLAAGVAFYLRKPVHSDVLLNAVTALTADGGQRT